MRFRAILAAIPAAVLCLSSSIQAQVAPAATVGGRPIGLTVAFSDYSIDYGPDRRMQGVMVRGGVGVFRGLGVDVSARTIFMNTPPRLTRMQQNTFLAGAFYETSGRWRVRPFARFAGGIGTIEFPSRNPFYTRDTFTVYGASGGIEYPIIPKLYLRGEYEYQFWLKYQGPNQLNPQGGTLGVTYYLRGKSPRPHSVD
jgi:opacity protein-like surface antigen